MESGDGRDDREAVELYLKDSAEKHEDRRREMRRQRERAKKKRRRDENGEGADKRPMAPLPQGMAA